MTIKKTDLYIDQGTTYSIDLNLYDDNGDAVNLTGYSASSLIKQWYTSQISTPFNVVINGNSGIITLNLDANTSTNLRAGRYVYDVNIKDSSNNVTRVFEGLVTISPSVTFGVFSTNNTWYDSNGYHNG